MKYIKGIMLLLSVMFVFETIAARDASAQRRLIVSSTSRPITVRRVYYYRPYYDPFWRGTLWDPYYSWYYDPYYYDPYLRLQRDKYYKEKAVRDARRNLAKSREKYASDGYLTAKERKKLAKKQRKYAKAVASLAKFNRNY
jgi:hypothetical protein